MKTLRLTNDLWRKTLRRAYICRRLAEKEKHLLCKLCSPNNSRFDLRNSAKLVCLWIAMRLILASVWFWTVKWSKQKVLTNGNILRGHLALHCLHCESHWLICCSKSTALWLINKNNIVGYKIWRNPYLVSKLAMLVSFLEWNRSQSKWKQSNHLWHSFFSFQNTFAFEAMNVSHRCGKGYFFKFVLDYCT